MTANPALATLQFLVGAWDMELSEAAFLPGPDARVHSPVSVESGVAVTLRSHVSDLGKRFAKSGISAM